MTRFRLDEKTQRDVVPGLLRHDAPVSVSDSRFLASRQLSDDIDLENSGCRDGVGKSLPVPRPRCTDPALTDSHRLLTYLLTAEQ